MLMMIKALQINYLADYEDKGSTCLRFVKSNHGINTVGHAILALRLNSYTFTGLCCDHVELNMDH